MVKLEGRVSVKRLYGEIYRVPGSAGGGPLQAKTAYPKHSEQIIIPDEDYYGLVSVTVKPVPKIPACVVSVTTENEGINIGATVAAVVSVETPKRLSAAECEVVPVDGAQYGFALNSNGYYESQNKGVDNSYAMCKIVSRSNVPGFIEIRYIRYAENADYGLISTVDTMLSMNYNTDSTATKLANSAEEQAMYIAFPAGEHFVCVKYKKDSSVSNNNDSLQFKISE